jgi:hypothetical protein
MPSSRAIAKASVAEALRHYAKRRNDPELERWMSEIRLRAIAQIGEISRELEKSKGGANPQATLPNAGKSKEAQLASARTSTSTANRYEQLAASEEHLAPSGTSRRYSGLNFTEKKYRPKNPRCDPVRSSVPVPSSQ